MSFPELLEAVKALPQAEKLELLNVLADDVGGGSGLTPAEVTFLQQFPTGVTLHPGWQVTTDEAGWQVLQQAMAENKASK
jgi:hypothetical protein